MKWIRIGLLLSVILNYSGAIASLERVDSLGTKAIKGKNFIEHRVEEHEGWYGIARRYGVSYGDLRNANKELSDTLHIGQVIRIPIEPGKINDAGNIKKDSQHGAQLNQASQPVFHVVKQKETLFAIAKKFKVTKEQLKKWNHLTTAGLKVGDSVIVGYKNVMVKQEQITKNEVAAEHHERKELNEKGTIITAGEKIKNVPNPDKDSSKSAYPVTKNDHDTLGIAGKPEFAVGRKEIMEQGVATWIDDENINPNKYFALHRNAPVGTIVKVTNRMNKRAVFVKVVGKLPDTGDNENSIIKISKASAEKLGVRDQRFQCDLSYGITAK